jgi:hypothetical protein
MPLCITIAWQGRFEILCLSGSYLLLEEGGTRTRSGGLCIALCGPDHRVIGGSVGGVLTAAGTVQVMKSIHDISEFWLFDVSFLLYQLLCPCRKPVMSIAYSDLLWLSYNFGSYPWLLNCPR